MTVIFYKEELYIVHSDCSNIIIHLPLMIQQPLIHTFYNKYLRTSSNIMTQDYKNK